MIINIDKRETVPIYLQIVGQIKEKIFDGTINEGYALPSERKLAADLGVHRNTVTKAYHELKAEGLIFASQGKGYRVALHGGHGHLNEQENFQRKPVNWE